ncbi:hypothetical protein C8R44DRAFT_729398 [Mycena epipterygia]|nr:hypothetical protein C8R44DRAFT_729398 [Mycena epipterygia]
MTCISHTSRKQSKPGACKREGRCKADAGSNPKGSSSGGKQSAYYAVERAGRAQKGVAMPPKGAPAQSRADLIGSNGTQTVDLHKVDISKKRAITKILHLDAHWKDNIQIGVIWRPPIRKLEVPLFRSLWFKTERKNSPSRNKIPTIQPKD